MGITLPENNNSLADEFAQADFSEFTEVTPESQPAQIDVSPELDGEIFKQDFSETSTEVAGALKHNFTPAQINTALKDPVQTIMLHSDVDKDTAEKTLELAAIAPNIPTVAYDDETREILEYAGNELSQNRAIKTYHYLQKNVPNFVRSITDPSAAKIIMDATANGDLVWSQLHDLLTERNAGFFGRKWQALKAGASSLAKSTGELNWAVADVLDKINDGYIEDLNNGGLSIEQEKSQSEVTDLKQHYNGQITELELQLEKHRGTNTGLKLARQIIDLEEKRDQAVETITARGDSHYAEEVLIAKTVAADLKQQTAEIRTYLDSAPWLNTLLMSDASLFEKGVSAVPQVMQQVLLYATGVKEAALGLTAAQSFSSSYSRSRKEGVSIPTALVTASLRSAIETGGEAVTFGLLSSGTGAAKKLLLSQAVTTSALKETGKAFAVNAVKEGGTEALQNALGTGVEAAGFAIDNVMSTSEIGDILYNEGIVGSAEEGIIGGMLMLPSMAGVSVTQLKRITEASKRTANLVELTQKAEEIEAASPKVKEELIKSVTPVDPENTTEYFQDSFELAQAVTSEIVQEVKIHAGALKTILDSDFTDTAEKTKLLNALGINEEDIAMEVEHGGYISTTASKALAYGNTVFWEQLAPYTLQYNQELTQAETERFTTALDSIAESMKELDNSEIILTRAEREQAAYKMLKKEFPTKSDEESIKSAATILTRLFESIERGIDSKDKSGIMSNIAQGFALRRGENGQINFLHKNNLADIRNKRAKLKIQKETANAKKTKQTESIKPELAEVELSAQEKDETIFRTQEGLGTATTGILSTLDPNTDIYNLNGAAIIEAMRIDGIIADIEVELFVSDNQLTPEGVEFIDNALLSNMVGNSALLDSLTIPAKNKLKAITPYLLAVDALNPEQSILADLRQALLYTTKLKKKKLTEIDSNAGKLDTWFNSRPKAHIEQAARAYLQTIRLGSSLAKDQLIDEIIHSGERFLSKAEKQEKLTQKKEELEEAEIVTQIAIEEAQNKEAELKESANSTESNSELMQQLEAAQKEIELLKSQKEALAKDREAVEQENFILARNADISLPSGKTIAAEFDIIEASDLIISHDPESFAPNPDHGSGQERNYHNDTELKTAIETSTLDVRKVINNSPLPTSGAPIVSKDNIVHGGNGRSMRIARHYNRGLSEYSDFLYQHSEHYGITREELSKFDRPVLVRRLTDDVTDAGRLSAEVNDDDTQSKNQALESYGLANRLGENTLSIINSIEDNQSARDFIASNGSELIDALLADGAIAQSDIARLYDSKNNVVTENGKIIIENALFGAAIHDLDVMSALAGNRAIKNKVIMIAPLVVSTQKRPDWDISNLLRIGAKHIIAKNNSKGGKSWSDYIAQQELFTTDLEMDKNGIGVNIGIWLEKTPAKQLRQDLTSYINKIPTGTAGSTDLFGGNANYTVTEALAELLNLEVEEINAKVQTFTTGNIDNELEQNTESVVKDKLTTENTESPVYYQSAELSPTEEELEAAAIQETAEADSAIDPMQVLEDNILFYSRIYNVMDESGIGSLALGRAWEYLLTAQESYNPDKGSYEGWLKQAIKFACMDEAKKLRRHFKEQGSLTSLNSDGEFEDAYFEPVAKGMSNEEIDGKVANAIGEFLAGDDRWAKHKQVFDLFRDGVKQQEIAAKLDITQGRVAQIIKEIGKDKEIQEVERITRENIFYKNNGDNFRGKITFNEETFSSLITLAKSGDVMTFLHETSHFYLGTVEQLVNNGKANEDLTKLYNDIKNALNVKDGKRLSSKNHEYFARSFEAYLSSGKAPTSSLLKAFNTLKRFAAEVYRYLKETFGRDNISPEIRDVFDRILATDEELTRYRSEKNLSNTAESVFADARKTAFGDESTEETEQKRQARRERQEERLFKAVQISFAKHNGYQNAKKAAEKTVSETPFYAAIDEIIEAGGISYNTIKELVGKNNAKFLKRHNTKDNEFITSKESEIILEDIANRHGYADRDNPVDGFLSDLISKPTTKEAINIMYTENKEIVTSRLREELRNRELLRTEDTRDEISDMLFDVVALRMAFEEVQQNTGKKREYSTRAKEARARARERKQIIEEKVKAELDSLTVLKAADYKFRQREANKRGREVDNELIRLRGMLNKKKLQKKVSSEILDKIEALQSERAYWQLSAKLSLEINDELQKQVKSLGLRRLQTKLNSVREDYKKAILDLIYTYRLPATIREKRLDLNLLQRHNTKLEDFNSTMLQPHEVSTPVKERFTLDTDPTQLMSDWIRQKERRSKDSINNSSDLTAGLIKEQQPTDQSATYMDMRWADFTEVANLIESYIQLGSEELDVLKHKNAETVDAAVALLEKNTTTQSDKKLMNGETQSEKNRVKRFLRELQANKTDTLRKAYRGITATFAMQEFDMLRADGFKRGFYYKVFTNFRSAAIDFNKRHNKISSELEPHYKVLQQEVNRLKAEHGRKHVSIAGLTPPENFREKYGDFTVDNIIAMCLNMGNDANIYALIEGMGFGSDKYQSWLQTLDEGEFARMTQKEIYDQRIEFARKELDIIQSQLTAEGWQAIQNIWKTTGSLFTDLNSASYKMYRKSLTEETPTQLTITSTKDGQTLTLEGGYYPLRYDTRLTSFKSNEDSEEVELNDRRNGIFGTTGINKASMFSRMRSAKDNAPVVRRPVLLDLNVLPQHIDDTIRVITHGALIKETQRIFNNLEFKTLYEKKYGRDKYINLIKWLHYQGNPRMYQPTGIHGKLFNSARSLFTVKALALNVGVAGKQPLSLPSGINEMNLNGKGRLDGYRAFADGVSLIARGAANSISKGKLQNEAIDFVFTASEYMKDRDQGAYNLHLSDMRTRKLSDPKMFINGREVTRDKLTSYSFAMVHMADKAAVMPLWMGAFTQSLRNTGVTMTSNLHDMLNPDYEFTGEVKDAIEYADHIISMTQPTTLSTDKAPIQLDTLGKSFSVFMTYTLRALNKASYYKDKLKSKEMSTDEAIQTFIEMFVLPALISTIAGYVLAGDDEEKDLSDFALDLGVETVNQVKGTIPFVRSVGFDRYGQNPLTIPAMEIGRDFWKPVKNTSQQKFLEATYSAACIGSTVAGAPIDNGVKSVNKIYNLVTTGSTKGDK